LTRFTVGQQLFSPNFRHFLTVLARKERLGGWGQASQNLSERVFLVISACFNLLF